jgi:hypothetical protein
MAKAEAWTMEGDQCWAMATTARTFIGSMGMGSRYRRPVMMLASPS